MPFWTEDGVMHIISLCDHHAHKVHSIFDKRRSRSGVNSLTSELSKKFKKWKACARFSYHETVSLSAHKCSLTSLDKRRSRSGVEKWCALISLSLQINWTPWWLLSKYLTLMERFTTCNSLTYVQRKSLKLQCRSIVKSTLRERWGRLLNCLPKLYLNLEWSKIGWAVHSLFKLISLSTYDSCIPTLGFICYNSHHWHFQL